MQTTTMSHYQAENFLWNCEGGVGTITLNRPERKNPLTFESYAELRDLFRSLVYATDVDAVVIRGAGGNFCSGGDVHEIIGPLTEMNMKDLMAFTRMTGDLVKAMRACRQPIVSAIDGICAGAGAIIAMASDLRYAGPTFANGITKTQLHQQWNMSVDQSIECEAQAQAICMQTEDFKRAYRAFISKEKPVFSGE